MSLLTFAALVLILLVLGGQVMVWWRGQKRLAAHIAQSERAMLRLEATYKTVRHTDAELVKLRADIAATRGHMGNPSDGERTAALQAQADVQGRAQVQDRAQAG